jgi:hypothetical protein
LPILRAATIAARQQCLRVAIQHDQRMRMMPRRAGAMIVYTLSLAGKIVRCRSLHPAAKQEFWRFPVNGNRSTIQPLADNPIRR